MVLWEASPLGDGFGLGPSRRGGSPPTGGWVGHGPVGGQPSGRWFCLGPGRREGSPPTRGGLGMVLWEASPLGDGFGLGPEIFAHRAPSPWRLAGTERRLRPV